ncbi:MAG: PQQ-dependent sugar dehydrogenase [Acidobacteriota bacterium]
MTTRFLLTITTSLLLGGFCPLKAVDLPNGFAQTQMASGLSGPTAMEFAPDGRLFVALEGGQVRVIKNGLLLPAPFVTVNVDSSGERGLLGITVDPNFTTNHFVYLYYTTATFPARNRVTRFTADGDVALSNSETVILELDILSGGGTVHNGGAIHFGPDGTLYIAVGDDANGSNAQTLNNQFGKMLRVNADGTIPTNNPFYNSATGANRAIWALGLRNPFTFVFQPGTGRMFINDVGEISWEEIDDGIAGSNYGWPITEGPSMNPSYTAPIFSYAHTSAEVTGCAITGGAFYNPASNQFPASYTNKYFFADFCNGWIRALETANYTSTGFATGLNFPVDLKVASDGSLYYLQRGGGGAVFRIQYASAPASIMSSPADQTALQGQSVTFQVTAGGSTPLSYQWQRNMVNIPGANASSYLIQSARLADNGARFRCLVSNALGTATSNEATLTVQPTAPILVTQENTEIAIALTSVTMMRDPFSLTDANNFSSDNRSRLALFSTNLELLPGENSSAITARAEDASLNVYPLTVEFAGNVPNFDWLTQVIVRLPNNLPTNQDVWVTITLHAKTSNKVRFRIR